ncbi:unnamed protein product [Colletotrichum noveboracense]|uniref:Uncharacterized protein n=1 Tax=Colletotrichum noveboracense TaxID=2664923 RepID=A0A9W4S063_9PEZI|nr:unnamed protein product [Colletotrichum noveboracense]
MPDSCSFLATSPILAAHVASTASADAPSASLVQSFKHPSLRPPSRLPSAFLTASLLPPLDDSRGSIALSSNSVSTKRRATLPLRCWCVGDHSGLMPCRWLDWPERP